MKTISTEQAKVTISDTAHGSRIVAVEPYRSGLFVPISSFETRYPVEMIEMILEIKGADYVCDELAREEDPAYVLRDLESDLRAYFDLDSFAGERILDFGCGGGASTMVLSRLFPKAEIVGVELDETLLSIARARHDFYGYANVSLKASPSGSELPLDIGSFQLVILSAVYEHLLPEERKTVIPMIWEHVRADGFLFLNMTPHRYFPIEHHTTGLPIINYLPDFAAFRVAQKFSNRIPQGDSWEVLLRRGIRGATETQILGLLNKVAKSELLEPHGNGIKDRIDLWYSQLSQSRMRLVKQLLRSMLKSLKAVSGIVLVPNLSLVFQKRD